MASNVRVQQSLDNQQAIVNDRGVATDYFIQFIQNRAGALTDLDAIIALIQAEIDALELAIVDVQDQIDDLADGLLQLQIDKADKATQIIAGVGLTGGGDLSTDRTIDLENTAVTPGSYTNTNLTVDAQGRITAAANGSGGGGGGGGSSAPFVSGASGNLDVASVSANYAKGMVFTPEKDMQVSAIVAFIDPAAVAENYVGFIASLNSATPPRTIVAVLGTTSAVTSLSTNMLAYRMTFASPVSLVAGTPYVIGVRHQSGATTAVMRVGQSSPSGSDGWRFNAPGSHPFGPCVNFNAAVAPAQAENPILVADGSAYTIYPEGYVSPPNSVPWWYSPPTAASLSLQAIDAVNLVLTDDTQEGLLIAPGAAPAVTRTIRMAYRTLTNKALDWDLVVRMPVAVTDVDFKGGHLMMHDSVGGRAINFGWRNEGVLEVTRWSAFTGTPTRTAVTTFNNDQMKFDWFRIQHTGTTYNLYGGVDGKSWVLISTFGDTAQLLNRADRVGIGFWFEGANNAIVASCQYFSLTGPGV